MADASSVRKANSLSSAGLVNKSGIRYYTPTNRLKLNNGANWVDIIEPNTFEVTTYLTATGCFYTATSGVRIKAINLVYDAKEGSALTINVTKDAVGVTPGSGTALLSSAFDATADPYITEGTLVSNSDTLLLKAGDRLSLKYSTTVSLLTSPVVTVTMERIDSFIDVTQPFASISTNKNIFVAPSACKVEGVWLTFSTAGTISDARMQIQKETGTTAPGAGTANILAGYKVGNTTTTSSDGFNLTGAINTPQEGILVSSAAGTPNLYLAAGDRLSFKTAGTLTSVAGVVITVKVKSVNGKVSWIMLPGLTNASVDMSICGVSYPFVLSSIIETHTAVSADTNLQVTKDISTSTVAGTGADILTNDTNAGFAIDSDINTPVFGTYASTTAANNASLLFNKGNRLSIDFAGSRTGYAGGMVVAEVKHFNT